jgi:hypothetical protein
MSPREAQLVKHIQSEPKELELNFALDFPRSSRASMYDFDAFLPALGSSTRSSRKLRKVAIDSHKKLGIAEEDEWTFLLLRTIGLLGTFKACARSQYFINTGLAAFIPSQHSPVL